MKTKTSQNKNKKGIFALKEELQKRLYLAIETVSEFKDHTEIREYNEGRADAIEQMILDLEELLK
jgi:hypothetical protein